MSNFKITLPAKLNFTGQDVIVTDPCYFMPDTIWKELIKAWYPDRNEASEFANWGVIEFNNGAKVIYSSTAHGDGSYPVYVSKSAGTMVHANETGVDAGLISVVTVEDIKKIEKDFGYHNGKPFDENNNWYPRVNNFDGLVEADGEGNFTGDLEVMTKDFQDEDDYAEENYDEDEEDLGF